MSEEKEILTKGQIALMWLGRHWFWVVLVLFVAAGCYLSAIYLWKLFKGGEKEK